MSERVLHILHFNDVYHPDESSGRRDGAARFISRIEEDDVNALKPLVIFSGDLLAPSVWSTFTKGQHMMEVLDIIGVDVATPGNHDFDFGVDQFRNLIVSDCLFEGKIRTKSVWVSTNIDSKDGSPIGGCHRYTMIESHGIKVGFLGLSEDWLSDSGLNSDPSASDDKFARWVDQVERGLTFAKQLRADGAELVFALVHNLADNTQSLATALRPHVDFVFGGHEHSALPADPATAGWVISGFNFEEFSLASFRIPAAGPPPPPAIRRVAVAPQQPIAASPRVVRLQALLGTYRATVLARMGEPMATLAAPLDCRKLTLRSREASGGSFFADAALHALAPHGARAAVLIAGVVSSHREWPAGLWTMGQLVEVFPWDGAVVLRRLLGRDIWEALEHGVALLPSRFGRFPQVAGLSFVVDATAPPHHRVSSIRIRPAGAAAAAVADDDVPAYEPLDPAEEYLIATTEYVAAGGDGHAALARGKPAGPAEGLPLHGVMRDFMCGAAGAAWRWGGGRRIVHKTGFEVAVAEGEETTEEALRIHLARDRHVPAGPPPPGGA